LKRSEKAEIVKALSEKCATAKAAILTDYRGLDTAAMSELRRQLRQVSVDYQVVKNTLMARASDGTDIALLKDYFAGPSAVALTHDDPAASAKVLVKFGEQYNAFKVKAGVLNGKVIDAAGVHRLSMLPPREILLGQLLSVLVGPVRSFVTVLGAVPRDFVGVLNAYKEKKEKEGSTSS